MPIADLSKLASNLWDQVTLDNIGKVGDAMDMATKGMPNPLQFADEPLRIIASKPARELYDVVGRSVKDAAPLLGVVTVGGKRVNSAEIFDDLYKTAQGMGKRYGQATGDAEDLGQSAAMKAFEFLEDESRVVDHSNMEEVMKYLNSVMGNEIRDRLNAGGQIGKVSPKLLQSLDEITDTARGESAAMEPMSRELSKLDQMLRAEEGVDAAQQAALQKGLSLLEYLTPKQKAGITARMRGRNLTDLAIEMINNNPRTRPPKLPSKGEYKVNIATVAKDLENWHVPHAQEILRLAAENVADPRVLANRRKALWATGKLHGIQKTVQQLPPQLQEVARDYVERRYTPALVKRTYDLDDADLSHVLDRMEEMMRQKGD